MFKDSPENIDKLFQQGAENHDFEYKAASWDKLEVMLNRNKRRYRLKWLFGSLIILLVSGVLYFNNTKDSKLNEEVNDTLINSERKPIIPHDVAPISIKEEQPKVKEYKSDTGNKVHDMLESDVVANMKNESLSDSKSNSASVPQESEVKSHHSEYKSSSKSSLNTVDENSESELLEINSEESHKVVSTLITLNMIGDKDEKDVAEKGSTSKSSLAHIQSKSDKKIDGNYQYDEENVPASKSVQNVDTTDSEETNPSDVNVEPLGDVQIMKSLPGMMISNNDYPISLSPIANDGVGNIMAKNHANYWVIGLILSSGSSTVDLAGFSDINWQVGGQVEYQFLHKYGLNIGAIYNQKKYRAGEGEYIPPEGFWTRGIAPNSIDASCNVLEIPAQINYYFNGYEHHSLMANIGVNSFIMLKERYHYSYENPEPDLIQTWGTENENKHWFGMAQASVGYQFYIGPQTAIIAAPFVQIPIKGIGHGNVKLWSTGLSLKLNWRVK